MSSITNPGFSNSSGTALAQPLFRLSVIIVSWNIREMLRGCLQSLEDDHAADWVEVIVVDNASHDGSAEMVAEEFPWVKLIESGANLGFSRGNNLGIRQAGGDFILLLNPDTLVHTDALRRMVDFAQSHPEIGVLGPRQCSEDGSIQFEGAVNFPTPWNVFCDLSLLSKLFSKSRLFCGRKMGYWDHADDREVPAVPGSAMLVRREVFDRVGLLDSSMFYAEDMDFCWRARRAGWRLFYLGSASITHFGGACTAVGKNEGLYRQIAFQSFWLYMRKNRGWLAAVLVSAMVLLWSTTAVVLTSVLRIFLRNASAREKLQRFREIAVSLLQWSLQNKWRFRHHLAAPAEAQ